MIRYADDILLELFTAIYLLLAVTCYTYFCFENCQFVNKKDWKRPTFEKP